VFDEVTMRSNRLKSAGRSLLLVPVLGLGLGTGLQAQEEKGWIGITFEDAHCRGEKRDEGRIEVWICSEPPVIVKVADEGPAFAAGMRSGDVIVGVNGLEITTEEAGRLFANIRLGVPLTFWLRRDGEELALSVMPTTREGAFGEDAEWVPMGPGLEDSLAVQMRLLFENQVRLQYAVKDAEVALRRAESRLREDPSEQRRAEVVELRLQIDSIHTKLLQSQTEIRLQVDSLASRAWLKVPDRREEPRPEAWRLEPYEGGVVSVYGDAVAGARFEKLDEESPLIDYFPGVEAGLLVIDVAAETPAALCGLRPGDVVLEVNEEPVGTVAELRCRMRGEVVITFVRRGGKHFCTILSR
jgi:membrane-associated protease RseP (regulator of RpoE activity)